MSRAHVYIRIVLVVTFIYLTFLLITSRSGLSGREIKQKIHEWTQVPVHSSATTGHNHLDTALLDDDESIRPLEDDELRKYVRAIFDPEDGKLPRLTCEAVNLTRYEDLIPQKPTGKFLSKSKGGVKYLFAFNLHQNIDVLPRLMASVMQALRFLGPENCAISIMEGRSDDGTYQVLEGIKSQMEEAKVPYFLESTFIDPYGGDGNHRIERLSAIRNLALEPLFSHRFNYVDDLKILFINDVQLCVEDILEMVYQHEAQGATMTCGMDWSVDGTRFRDSWVARTIMGNLFNDITHDGDWSHAKDIFFDDPFSRQRYENHNPVQVYSCWNGATVIDAEPFLKHGIRFRAAENKDECKHGEPVYLAKDLWRLGEKYGKIQIVPTANVAYTVESAEYIKHEQGRVTDYINTSLPPSERQVEDVPWRDSPPQYIKCIQDWGTHYWTDSLK